MGWALAMLLAAAPAPPLRGEALIQALRERPLLSLQFRLADCDDLVRHNRKNRWSWFCYCRLAWGSRDRAAAIERLERGAAAGDPRAKLYLGVIISNQRLDRAEQLFAEAGAALAKEGDVTAAARARLFHHAMLRDAGRLVEADRELAEVRELAPRADEEFLGLLRHFEAERAVVDADYGTALRGFREARDESDRTGLFWVRHRARDGLAQVLSLTGRHREAFEIYGELVRLLEGDPYFQALARHGLAAEAVRLSDDGELPGEESGRLLEEALAAEIGAGIRHYEGEGEASTRLLLALRRGPTGEGVRDAEEALRIGLRDGHPTLSIAAGRLLAKLLSDREPGQPARPLLLLSASIERARQCGRRLDVAMGQLVRADVLWRSGDLDGGVREALAALDRLDDLRARQPEATLRARSSAELARAYALVAGWLLDPRRGVPAEKGVALSLDAMERLRARALLEALEAAGASPAATPGPLHDERQVLLARIASAERGLLGPLPEAARVERLAELDQLDRAEEDVRDRLARAHPELQPRLPARPSLADLQAALAEGEALLAFQTWAPATDAQLPLADGSSWLLAVDRSSARAFRIPDAPALGRSTRVLLALIARRDGTEQEAARAFGDELLAPALDWLGPRARRLVVVPDGPLHFLPFAALAPAGEQLGAAREISLAPSLALWLRWRRERPEEPRAPLLALADPRAGEWAAAAGLGPLAWAQAEASDAVRLAGGELFTGEAASEALLKQPDLRRFAIVHLAAHAVIDEERPDLSAVLLSPGGGQDGLLRPRDAAALDLRGRLVVLAACSSARGALLRGEGLLGLSRAFFQAGAHAVVGSLMPLRDDAAAAFFASFYAALAQGKSVAAALAAARSERMQAGAPAADWAAVSLTGDGALTPLPRGSRAFPPWGGRAAAAALLFAAGLVLLRRRAR